MERTGKLGQAMLEYVLVFTALAISIVVSLVFFTRASEQKSIETMRVVTSDYP